MRDQSMAPGALCAWSTFQGAELRASQQLILQFGDMVPNDVDPVVLVVLFRRPGSRSARVAIQPTTFEMPGHLGLSNILDSQHIRTRSPTAPLPPSDTTNQVEIADHNVPRCLVSKQPLCKLHSRRSVRHPCTPLVS